MDVGWRWKCEQHGSQARQSFIHVDRGTQEGFEFHALRRSCQTCHAGSELMGYTPQAFLQYLSGHGIGGISKDYEHSGSLRSGFCRLIPWGSRNDFHPLSGSTRLAGRIGSACLFIAGVLALSEHSFRCVLSSGRELTASGRRDCVHQQLSRLLFTFVLSLL